MGGGRSAGKEQKYAFSRNIGCRKNRGIARDLLYAEPELGAGHSQVSLSTAVLTSISSCIRPITSHTRAHPAAIKPQTGGMQTGMYRDSFQTPCPLGHKTPESRLHSA
jgi:hypothetical protein